MPSTTASTGKPASARCEFADGRDRQSRFVDADVGAPSIGAVVEVEALDGSVTGADVGVELEPPAVVVVVVDVDVAVTFDVGGEPGAVSSVGVSVGVVELGLDAPVAGSPASLDVDGVAVDPDPVTTGPVVTDTGASRDSAVADAPNPAEVIATTAAIAPPTIDRDEIVLRRNI